MQPTNIPYSKGAPTVAVSRTERTGLSESSSGSDTTTALKLTRQNAISPVGELMLDRYVNRALRYMTSAERINLAMALKK